MLYLGLHASNSVRVGLFQIHTIPENDGSGLEKGSAILRLGDADIEIEIQKKVCPEGIRFLFQTRRFNSGLPFNVQESIFTKPPQTTEEQILSRKGDQQYTVYVMTIYNSDGIIFTRLPVEEVPFLKGLETENYIPR